MAKEQKVSSAVVYKQLISIKDKNSSEARKLRKQLRDMGVSVRELSGSSEKEPKVKKVVKEEAPKKRIKNAPIKGPVTKPKRSKVVESDDEDLSE